VVSALVTLAAGRARSRLGTLALTVAAGVTNGTFIGIGHNFMHHKENWRRHYLDFSGRSCAEMRVHHVLSHHAYTNTIVDIELQRMEPHVSFMPGDRDEAYQRTSAFTLFQYIVLGIPSEYLERLVKISRGKFRGTREEHLSQLLPLWHLCLLASGRSLPGALLQWLGMMVTTSTAFQTGNYFTGPHFSSSVWHQGDMLDSLDWGVAQIQTMIERSKLPTENSLKNNCVNTVVYGLHYLHHLFPTVDAMKLSELVPIFQETCAEFGVQNSTWTDGELRQGTFDLLRGYGPIDRTLNGQFARSKL